MNPLNEFGLLCLDAIGNSEPETVLRFSPVLVGKQIRLLLLHCARSRCHLGVPPPWTLSPVLNSQLHLVLLTVFPA